MSRRELQELVMKLVRELQDKSGREVPEITRDTIPMRDVPGFDSLNAAEVETMLAGALGLTIDEHVFYTEDGKQLFRVREIAAHLEEIISEKGN